MNYSDSHVEFIHHQDDLVGLDPAFISGQINPSLINQVQPDLLFLAIYVDPAPNAWGKMLWVTQEYLKTIKENNWQLVLSKADLNLEGIKVILHVEDLAGIGEDLEKIDQLFSLGIRSIGLTHNQANQFAGGSLTPNEPLTELGSAAIQRLARLGVILDFAHLSTQSFKDVVSQFSLPAFVSHAGVQGAFANPRNLPDEILTLIKQHNGYLGVGLAGSFLAKEFATREDYLRQIDYAVSHLGPDKVGVGSDLGGIVSFLAKDLENISRIPELTPLLPDPAILGENLHHLLLRSNLHSS